MNALPSLVSSGSSSASEDTSSASVEVDNNIRASLTLPGLVNNGPRSVNPQPNITRQNRPRLTSSNQQPSRHVNRSDQNTYISNGHQQGNYLHHNGGNPNYLNKSSATSECNLSICYSYMLAAISSIMVVVGIYLSLTRFNLNYLYLSLAGLMLVALGACLYCIGRIQLNRKARRKLRLSDDDLEAMDQRGLAAAASHILNTRGLVQIGNNGLNSVNSRHLTNQNLGASSENGTATTDSLLVMINPNNENGPISILSTSCQKQFTKGPIENCDSQMTMQQLDQLRPQHISGQLTDADEAFGSTTDNDNEVAMSQLSLNMIPQYFSNGVSLRPNKLCQPIGPESSSVINLTSGAFGPSETSRMPSDTTEKSLADGGSVLQSCNKEPSPLPPNSDITTATSSKDQGQLNPTTSRLDRTDIDLPNASMGPLSQSQIVNVNGRQFLILPLNDNKPTSVASNSDHITLASQDDNNNSSELTRSSPSSSDVPESSHKESPFTQGTTTEELINKIRTLTIGDSRQLSYNSHANTRESNIRSSRPQPLRRESSFTFNNRKSSRNTKFAQPAFKNNKSSPRGLKHSHSFNEKSFIHRSADTSANKFLVDTFCANNQQSNSNEPQLNFSSFAPMSTQRMLSSDQPCSSNMSHSIEQRDESIVKTGTSKTSPIDESDNLIKNRQSENHDSSDTRGQREASTAPDNANILHEQVRSKNDDLLPNLDSAMQNHQTESYSSDMQPSTSSEGHQDSSRPNNSPSNNRASTSNIHHRTTLIMGLSGEEELIEISDVDIDKMSMLPPSYESLMGQSCDP